MCYGYRYSQPSYNYSYQQPRTYVQPAKPKPKPPTTTKTATTRNPTAPTPEWLVKEALKLADVQSTDHVCDLGSGDGRVVIAAAKTYGCEAIGVERDSAQVAKAKRAIAAAGIRKAYIVEADVLTVTDLSEVDVVYMYLYPDLMQKLTPLLATLKEGARVVSYCHVMPGTTAPDRKLVIRDGNGKEQTLYMWIIRKGHFK
jgi:protein-L-isoaspartate O-methyltransferase